MTNEQILRWMLEFGTGWVPSYRLMGTWVWEELSITVAREGGYISHVYSADGSVQYNLTPKAIKQLEGEYNCVS